MATPAASTEDHGTLAGVLVPGGAAVALILGCNILHVLGPLALIGLLALGTLGVLGTVGLVARRRSSTRKSALRRAAANLGRTTKSTAAKTAAPRSPRPPRPAPATTARRPAARAAAAMVPPAARRSAPPPANRGGGPKPRPTNTRGVDPATGIFGRRGTAPKGAPTARTAKAATAPKAPVPSPAAAKRTTAPRRATAAPATGPVRRATAAARRAAGLPSAAAPKSRTGRKTSLAKKPTATTRTALRKAAAGTVATARWASPKLSRATAATARRIVRMHRRARKVRLHHPGPNWWPRLNRGWARVLTPALLAVRALMQRRRFADWIDTHRRLQAAPAPAMKAVPRPIRPGPHRPVTSPITKETAVSHPAIASAVESVQDAFAAVNGSPADNMREYEDILTGLPSLLTAIGAGLRAFADVSQDEFKVDTAIPDMLGDGSSHANELGSFLEDLHQRYRDVHEKQIENYEEATPGAEKWDVRANQ